MCSTFVVSVFAASTLRGFSPAMNYCIVNSSTVKLVIQRRCQDLCLVVSFYITLILPACLVWA